MLLNLLFVKRENQLANLNMKHIKNIVFLLLSFLFWSCKTSETNENLLISSDLDAKWEYFELKKEIEVKIINHIPATAFCGSFAFASATIVETEIGEQIRIIDLCNMSNYKENEMVKVVPDKKPEFSVMIPHRISKNPITKQNEPSELDLKIVKTTYGRILRK